MSIRFLPAVRGLLAVDNRLPRLTLSTADTSGTFEVPPDATPQHVVEALRPHIRIGGAEAVIPGIGHVTVVPANRRGRVAGKVALVTGAAQGFGYEIAGDLADQGAWVVLADINVTGVEAAAAQINAAVGAPVAVGVAMNVSDADSVSNAVQTAVAAFGGIDIFVSNAGVLKAASVKTQTVADLDFVTDINYKGYFLGVQAVARVMALQHAACPEPWFDIIQINSKSGLVGSNKNGSYAGSKFGAIGLTQSFALELVEDHVKVNAICPGNFLDGPLWSNPKNGLFVQYLNTGKVPGAKTVADVRKAYESKVPMGRGCTTRDVMTALYYLVEQHYETGQALPVTGGQVMLK